MSIKINSLEIEGVKRIKAVTLEPAENGLTVIGGKNGAGKTSVLDSIAWALGGERYRPSNPKREGDYNDPSLKVTLSNGIVVERSGKNSTLKVTDSTGKKGGQTLLDSFVEELAINLPKFMEATNKEKAKTLLQIIGVGDKLFELETKENKLYNERYEIGRIADRKEKYALELPHYDGVPEAPVSAFELIQRQQKILAQNGENQKKRENLTKLEEEKDRLEAQISQLQTKLIQVHGDLNIARCDVETLVDQSTAELEQNIADIDNLNIRIRANLDREKAFEDYEDYKAQYDNLTTEIDDVRKAKLDLLNGANLPLPELSVEDGELTYKGNKWDCLSGSEQLKVATAIVRKLKPECGFVLIDKLEAFDVDTLNEFGAWLESEGLQVIATRVSTGEECAIIIENGMSITNENTNNSNNKWVKGEF